MPNCSPGRRRDSLPYFITQKHIKMSFHNHDTDDYNKMYSPSERERATKFGNQLLADHDKRKEEKVITALQQEAQINESKVIADERAEKDDLKNQVMALAAIKSGLEKSYKEATDKLKDYEALSNHNKAIIKDLNDQREQLSEKDKEIKRLAGLLQYADGEGYERAGKEFFETISNQEMNLAHITDELNEAKKVIENIVQAYLDKLDSAEPADNEMYNIAASFLDKRPS